MTSRSDPEDVRLRFGMDPPRLEEQRHWEELVPGADEYEAAVRRLPGLVGHWPARNLEPRTVDEDGDA